jgi:hypothetical protein
MGLNKNPEGMSQQDYAIPSGFEHNAVLALQSFHPFGVSKAHPLLLKNSRIEMDAAAPSPTADATCFVLPCRASPAAKIPGTLVSNGSGSNSPAPWLPCFKS